MLIIQLLGEKWFTKVNQINSYYRTVESAYPVAYTNVTAQTWTQFLKKTIIFQLLILV